MSNRKNTAPGKAPYQSPARPITDEVLTRFLECISMLEVFERSLGASDEDRAPESMALLKTIRDLHQIHNDLDSLNMPTAAERLRSVDAMPRGSMKPKARAALRREIKAEIAAYGPAGQRRWARERGEADPLN